MCANACSGLPSTEKGLVITVLLAGGVSGDVLVVWLLLEEPKRGKSNKIELFFLLVLCQKCL